METTSIHKKRKRLCILLVLPRFLLNRKNPRSRKAAVHYYYSASDIENFKSGEIFKELSKERPLFSFFLSKKSDSVQDTVTEEDKKAVYEIIIKERYWLTYPSIPFAI